MLIQANKIRLNTYIFLSANSFQPNIKFAKISEMEKRNIEKMEVENKYNALHKKLKLETAQETAQETADLVTFTEEILNGKLHFLCSDEKAQ